MLYNILRDNKIFFIPYLIILMIAAAVLISFDKATIHVFTNQYHNGFSDILFALLTYLGDGLVIIIPALILIFFSLRHFIFLLTAYFSTGLITQILKRLVFQDILRPSRFLKDVDLHIVEGIDLLSGRSFPSGHATSAFALFLSLALMIRNQYIKLACFIMACLVAFSRVYLSQHFLIDITAGSLIGTMGTTAAYILFYRYNRNWHAWNIQKVWRHEEHA